MAPCRLGGLLHVCYLHVFETINGDSRPAALVSKFVPNSRLLD